MEKENQELQPVDNDEEVWQIPAIIERGQVEARLFSDEPDPWGP